MFQRVSLRKSVLAAAAAAMAIGGLSAPTIAAADPDDHYDRYAGDDRYASDYDACRHARGGHAVAGALIGSAIGAAIGAGASGGRPGGTLLGAGIGAAGGAAVGNSTVDCDGPPPPPAPPPPHRAYYDAGPPAYDEDDYDDDCTYARRPVYLPDGRVVHRMVQVCRDEYGRYEPAD
ncbi:MAG: hypothetical protein JO127_01515 [Caulobacteraceae bacterium]|nr:hypothetical protein [Caulobacteraceae bacterium]